MTTPTEKDIEKAHKITAWLINPVEIDHSDPLGDFKARMSQADWMQKLVVKALAEARESARPKVDDEAVLTLVDAIRSMKPNRDFFLSNSEAADAIHALFNGGEK